MDTVKIVRTPRVSFALLGTTKNQMRTVILQLHGDASHTLYLPRGQHHPEDRRAGGAEGAAQVTTRRSKSVACNEPPFGV